MTDREAFEAWISGPPYEHEVGLFGDAAAWPGNYRDIDVDLAWQAWKAAIAHERSKAPECARCESLSRSVMMDQTAHDMNLVAEKYAHKLALDLECVLSDYSGKWWSAAIETIGKYREEMNAIHERESPTFMGEPQL